MGAFISYSHPAVPSDLSAVPSCGFRTSDFTDFTIKVKNKDFAVHKAILASRSPVFDAMFQSTMLESETNLLVLDDVETGNCFGIFLQYVYFGTLNVFTPSIMLELIYVAGKYHVFELVKLCSDSLCKNMSPDLAARALLAGYLLEIEDLLKAALLSAKSAWDVVMRSPTWPTVLSHHSLATLIEEILLPAWNVKNIPSDSLHEGESSSIKLFNTGFLPANSGDWVQTQPSFTVAGKWRFMIVRLLNRNVSIFLVHQGIQELPHGISCSFVLGLDGNELIGKYHTMTYSSRVIHLATFNSTSFQGIILKIRKISPPSLCPLPVADFSELLVSSKYSDAEVVVQGKSFPVHKVLLSWASPWFSKRLSDVDKIEVEDFDADAFSCFLSLLYNKNEVPTVKHLQGAYRFCIRDHLMVPLRENLIRKFVYENVTEILLAAHVNKDSILKDRAFEFIFANFKEVVIQSTWKLMSQHPDLHSEFILFIRKKLGQSEGSLEWASSYLYCLIHVLHELYTVLV